jgi:hypothetical protein
MGGAYDVLGRLTPRSSCCISMTIKIKLVIFLFDFPACRIQKQSIIRV